MKAEKQAPVTGETTSDEQKTLCSREKLQLFKNCSNVPSCLGPTLTHSPQPG